MRLPEFGSVNGVLQLRSCKVALGACCAAAVLQCTDVLGDKQTLRDLVRACSVASMAAGLPVALNCLASDELRGDVQGLRSVAFSTKSLTAEIASTSLVVLACGMRVGEGRLGCSRNALPLICCGSWGICC